MQKSVLIAYVRPSQLAGRGSTALAQELTRPLRTAGHLEIAAPDMDSRYEKIYVGLHEMTLTTKFNSAKDIDADGDVLMRSPRHSTPFTQTLLLFVRSSAPLYLLSYVFLMMNVSVTNARRTKIYTFPHTVLHGHRPITSPYLYTRSPC